MGIFSKKKAPNLLQNRLAALSNRVAQLERDQRNLKLDYLETYDKVQRLMSRVAKRAALDIPALPPDAEDPVDPFGHLDPISARILRLRSNGMK